MPHRTQTTDPNVFADVAAVVGDYGYELLDLHDAFDTIGLDRCADFMAQILPTCQQQAADNTKQTLNEFSAAFDACR